MIRVIGILAMLAIGGAQGSCVDLVRDCGAVAGSTDASHSFTVCQALASIEQGGPGCVSVPAGTFAISTAYLNTSNIVYNINNGAIFTPWAGIKGSATIFALEPVKHSTTVPHIANVTIQGSPPGAFTVDTSQAFLDPWHVVPFALTGWLENITVANVVIRMADPDRDPHARFATQNPGIAFNYVALNGERKHPVNCHIVNITSTGGIWGYGTVQVRSGQNLTFENLDGTGGVTLRLESGGGGLEYIDNVIGHNITCRKGHAAFFSEPHTQFNGVFHVSDVVSHGCSVGAEMNGGYEQHGLPPGHFSNGSTVTGLVGYYDPPGFAQANATLIDTNPCTVCGNENVPINYKVALTGVQAIGFPTPSNRTTCAYWIRWKPCPYD